MKRMKLLLLLSLITVPFAVDARQTEVDLNFKTDSGLLQLRNGIWAWDWHVEAYYDLWKGGKAGTFEYGLIYQGREGDDLEWHQINWKSPKIGTDRVKWWTSMKLNYIPDRSVGPKGFGVHTRGWMQVKLNDRTRITTFVEPRWQEYEELADTRPMNLEYFGSKSRITLDRDINKNNTLHFGVTTYGNQKDKFNIETQWVFMWTIKL